MKQAELLSIIIPFHNEQEVISECQQRISAAVKPLDMQVEMLYVNDGSKDETLAILIALMQQDERIKIIDLSRNFGKEIAMTAGLDAAKGEAVVVIDADLQDPPELIVEMVETWRKGFDVVYAKRTERKVKVLLKKPQPACFINSLIKLATMKSRKMSVISA